MMRLLLMLVLTAASGMFFLPVLALAQSGPRQAADQAEAARNFRAYLEQDWKRWMEDYPVMATFIGYPGQSRRWSDDSPEGIEARIKHFHQSLATLKTISRDALPVSEQLNYDLYRGLLETADECLQYGNDPIPFASLVPRHFRLPADQMRGIQQDDTS